MSVKTIRRPTTVAMTEPTAAASRTFRLSFIQLDRYIGVRPARRPTTPTARLQFQDVRSPQPLIWSARALPTRPTKRPTSGPNANPKNGTSAKPGRIDTEPGPGSRKLSWAAIAYNAAPIAAYTIVRDDTSQDRKSVV